MCLIIDINVVHHIFPQPAHQYVPIFKALTERRARLVYGGRLLYEYQKMDDFRRLLYRLDQQGAARKVNDEAVELETKQIKNRGLCVSNDHHVIALAIVSGARLLCTADNNLKRDFKNAAMISGPR